MNIEIKMQCGQVYEVVAEAIAEKRAMYYSEQYGADYRKGVNEGMCNPNLLIDWIQNNMNWEEVEPIAKLAYSYNPIDLAEEFLNASFKVVS